MLTETNQLSCPNVVRITCINGGHSWQGSGVLISSDEVLTASHLVQIRNIGVASHILVTPNYNVGEAPFGSANGINVHYFPINDAGGLINPSDVQNDLAVIHLDQKFNIRTMELASDYNGGSVIVSGYPDSAGGSQVNRPEYVQSDSAYNILKGTSIGAGSSGGPVWSTDVNGQAMVYGVISASSDDGNGYFARITPSTREVLEAWMMQDELSAPKSAFVNFTNTSTGVHGVVSMDDLSAGAPAYLEAQYVWASDDGVALLTLTPNVFLHGGSGQDSIQVTSGCNVLDGGGGSNFLTGGSGMDTFFTDARGTQVVWNTLCNFHTGDSATLWGFMPGISSYRWEASIDGADDAKGATLRANIVSGSGRNGDGVDASITFAGLSVDQAKTLTVSTGIQNGSPYMYFSCM